MDQRGVAQVVQATVREDLGAGLEPHGLAKGGAAGQQLGGDAAQGAQHGPAGVDHLDLAVAGKGLGVRGQAGGVPPVVTGELT